MKYPSLSNDEKLKFLKENALDMAEQHRLLGWVKASSGNNKDALKSYKIAQSIYCQYQNEHSSEMNRLRRNIGMARCGLGSYKKSRSSSIESYKIDELKLKGEMNPSNWAGL